MYIDSVQKHIYIYIQDKAHKCNVTCHVKNSLFSTYILHAPNLVLFYLFSHLTCLHSPKSILVIPCCFYPGIQSNARLNFELKVQWTFSASKGTCTKIQPDSASYTWVPWVSERCREFSASKPSQVMMRRDTKMRREEGEEKNGQKARDKNATLVHQITHTNRHIMLSGNQYFPYLHSRQYISVCIAGPPSALKCWLQYLRFPNFYTVSVHSCTVLTHQS